jgi:hypothetical protein
MVSINDPATAPVESGVGVGAVQHGVDVDLRHERRDPRQP